MIALRVSDDKNLMIFVPLSGFDIAGALLLKYRILLYFSFLGEILLIKKQSQSQSQFKKQAYIYCFLTSSTSSIYLIIN